MAYINADIPEDEQVPIQFEKSLRRCDKNGNELFKLLRKCLYGSPTATRRYTQKLGVAIQMRNAAIAARDQALRERDQARALTETLEGD